MGSQPGLHALLIGSDCYLPNNIPGVGYYPSLNGCVRDIAHVEQFLRSRLALGPERLVKLTSTNTGDARPAEPRDQWPTYENMVAAFTGIVRRAQPGDQVYIHYSGHGARAKTAYPDLKGQLGLDECLVPIDIGNSEARYLRDLELAHILQQMVDQGLLVTIVLDSCHSGGATRGPVSACLGVRGVNWIDGTPRRTVSLVAPAAELARNWQRQKARAVRKVEAGAGWLPEHDGYLLLAACRPSESAYEYPFDGAESNGALTYWLLKSLAGYGPGLTYKNVYDRLLGLIHSQFVEQTPMLAGDGSRTVFGSDHAAVSWAVTVLQVDALGARIQLAAGRAQGVEPGARFAIYAGGSRGQNGPRVALATVVEARASDAWAQVSEVVAGRLDALTPGAQAVALGNTSVQLRRTVWLTQRQDLPAQVDQDTALREVAGALARDESGLLAQAAGGRPADYQVAANAAGEFEICDPAGQKIDLRPALPIAGRASAETVVRRLGHLARYRALLELTNYAVGPAPTQFLTLSLLGVQDDYRAGQRPNPQPFGAVIGGIPTLRAGQWTFLRIRNLAQQVLNIAVLDLRPDWSVAQVFPRTEDFMPFDPAESRDIPLQMQAPAAGSGRDVVKVFATAGPASYRWLQMGGLDEPPAPAGSTRGPQNALEEILAAIGSGAASRVDTAAYAAELWATAQTYLQITS